MEKINGIIKDGAVYVESRGHCENCDLRKSCILDEERLDANYCQIFVLGSGENFRYSPSLTERLKGGEKPKRMCLRDKSKVCDLCHECDIDISNPRYY